MAYDQGNFNNVSSGGGSRMRIWSYKTTVDTLATIRAAEYFGPMRYALHEDDLIYVVGTDGTAQLSVTSVVNAASVTTSLYSGAGSVDTADISDLAVTTAKLALLAVDEAQLAALAVTEAKLGAVSVTNGKIGLLAVDTGQLAALSVTNAKLAVSASRTVTVAVSAAEFLGMYAAPKLIVAAGGANTMHIVTSIAYDVDYVSAQFANGGVVTLQYDSTINGAGRNASADIAAAVFNGISADHAVGAVGALETGASSAIVNKGLYLSNETAPFITGDSTMNVHVTYSTVTTSV